MRIGVIGVGRIGAFHAATLDGLEQVEAVIVADTVPGVADAVAAELGLTAVADQEALFSSNLDGLVITTGTAGHAPLLRAAVAAGIPTFCEKPVAVTLEETLELTALVDGSGVPVHVGFQRRFDAGYRRLREEIASGRLGWLHTIRAMTHDQSPPPAAYLPTSGGIFRDCNVHDFDILRFVTGQEVASVYATGSNRGADFFGAAGDVDSATAILTLTDDTLVQVSSTRYNGGGHDVRMEVHGSEGAMAVGLDDSLALQSAEPGVSFPAGPQHQSFMQRFEPAYRAELTAFLDVARGVSPSPCTVRDALEAFRVAEACELSRSAHRPVQLDEVKSL